MLQGIDAVLPTYAREDVTFVEGDGCELVDADGRRYLDFGAGIAVVSLGHRHPAPLAAAHAQLDRLWHASNLYWTEPQVELAAKLSDRFGGAQSFFCNSGTEAVEAAIKYARKATGKPGIVALEGSFHGRSTGALAATGQPGKRAAFEPLMPGPRFARPNDVASLQAAFGDDVGLVILEPVLGEGGVVPLEPEFVAAARALCVGSTEQSMGGGAGPAGAGAGKPDAVLCLDEIQTGVGRTGTFFAFEQLGVRPDLVTTAKALANGLPIGALLVSGESVLTYGDHGSTFGGNPVACAAACAVVDAVDDDLLANVRARSAQLFAGLARLPVAGLRGRGLLIGFDVERPAGEVVAACRAAGLVVLTAGPHTIRLAPPLVVGPPEVDRALSILEEVL